MDKYQFLRDLQAIITGSEIDLIFGDFNIDYYNETESAQLKGIMLNAGYHQIVKVPTFVTSGSLFDRAYVRQYSRLWFLEPQCQVKSVYYSDHDSVQLCFSM